jgi:4-amino-4-deoxy-L-arabinose transferase-like glycosyltransferase
VSTRAALATLGLVAALLWVALSAAPPLRLDAGAPAADRFLSGFYGAERGDGVAFRWSGPDARLMLHGATPRAAALALRLSGERLVAQGEPTVELGPPGAALASFAVTPGWRVYRVLLPPGSAATPLGRAAPLELRTAVSRPGAGDEARDYRPLGVPLSAVALDQLGGPPGAPLSRVVWPLCLAGAALAAAALAGAPAGWQIAAPLAAGSALALWAWRDPYSLAWALPPAPWSLGLAALAAAALALWPRRRAARPELLCAAGLAILAAAMALMHTQLAIPLGAALGAVAVLLLGGLAAPQSARSPGPPVPQSPTDLSRAAALALLAAIFLLALGLRLFALDSVPFGLWRDEARHGIVALRIAEDPGYRPIYVAEERVQLPGLGLYPFALALELFGVHIWTMRLATALAGALTVLPLYAVAVRLSGRRGVGLLAALLLAASSWHISISRLAFPTVYEPLLSLGAWWALLAALAPRRPAPAWRGPLLGAVAGLLLGLAAQTYHIGRVTPLAAAWLALLLLAREPRRWRPWLVTVAAAALALGLVVAPFVAYALSRPADFNVRVGAVFLLSPEGLGGRAPLAALDDNLGRHLLMFTARGDANGRHHAPLRPLLDILTGAGLLVGLGVLLARPRDWRALFLLGALAVGLAPGLLAVDAPHAMRTFGAVAPACLIAAVGWAAIWGRLAAGPPRPLGRTARLGLLGAGAAAVVALNAALYFGAMPRNPEVFGGFYPVQSRMGEYVRETWRAGEQIYVPEEIRSHPSFAFLTSGLPVEAFSGADLSAPPRPGARFLLTGYFADAEAAALAPALGPGARIEAAGPPFPDGRGPTFSVLRIP